MKNVNYPPEVLQALRTFFVLHGQNKVEEVLVIHFAFIGLVFFENTVNKNVGKTWGVASQFLLFEHTVFVLIKSKVSIINPQTRLHREPISHCVLQRHVLRP